MRAALTATAVFLLLPALTLAREPAAQLGEVRETLKAEEARHSAAAAAADRAARDLADLQTEATRLASSIQALESELENLATESARLATETAAQEQTLTATAKAQEDVLTSLVQMAHKPPPAVLLRADNAKGAARAAAVMTSILNDAAVKSATLRQEVIKLQALYAGTRQTEAAQRIKLESLAAEREDLADALARKEELLKTANAAEAAAAARVKQLAAQAQSLGELLTKLDAPAPLPPSSRKPSGSSVVEATQPMPPVASRGQRVVEAGPPRRGGLYRPVAGRIATTFGQAGRFNNRNRGVTWRAAPQAVVLAPWGGQVAYAGPFRGYGNIVILKHRGSYYSVLAGLSRIAVQPGERLGPGAPLGQMGRSGAALDLYLEFRRNDTPINPLPWLAGVKSG